MMKQIEMSVNTKYKIQYVTKNLVKSRLIPVYVFVVAVAHS